TKDSARKALSAPIPGNGQAPRGPANRLPDLFERLSLAARAERLVSQRRIPAAVHADRLTHRVDILRATVGRGTAGASRRVPQHELVRAQARPSESANLHGARRCAVARLPLPLFLEQPGSTNDKP